MAENANDPVTVMITRIVRAGSVAPFEDALKAFIPTGLAFAGHLGVHVLRPPPGEREFGVVLKFRSQKEWEVFRNAPEYQSFLAEIDPYLELPQQVEILCGLESWFTPLGARGMRMPPRWKMAIVTWIGVCLMVYVVNLVFGWLTPDWSWMPRLLVSNALVVGSLTWAVMPVLIRIFRRWLFPVSDKASRK